MGVARAPVVGSGAWPACSANVLRFLDEILIGSVYHNHLRWLSKAEAGRLAGPEVWVSEQNPVRRLFRWKSYWACLKDHAPSDAPDLALYCSNPHPTLPWAAPETPVGLRGFERVVGDAVPHFTEQRRTLIFASGFAKPWVSVKRDALTGVSRVIYRRAVYQQADTVVVRQIHRL